MMSDVQTVEAVVVSDGLTYRIPGQDKPKPPETYVVLPANRGDLIEIERDDYDRFKVLGSIADPDSEEAALAKRIQHRWGPPAGAQPLSQDGNLPIHQLAAEARELGMIAARANGADQGGGPSPSVVPGDGEDDFQGVSASPPDDLDTSNADAVAALNVTQLKNLAKRENVEVPASANKAELVDAIVAGSSKSSK